MSFSVSGASSRAKLIQQQASVSQKLRSVIDQAHQEGYKTVTLKIQTTGGRTKTVQCPVFSSLDNQRGSLGLRLHQHEHGLFVSGYVSTPLLLEGEAVYPNHQSATKIPLGAKILDISIDEKKAETGPRLLSERKQSFENPLLHFREFIEHAGQSDRSISFTVQDREGNKQTIIRKPFKVLGKLNYQLGMNISREKNCITKIDGKPLAKPLYIVDIQLLEDDHSVDSFSSVEISHVDSGSSLKEVSASMSTNIVFNALSAVRRSIDEKGEELTKEDLELMFDEVDSLLKELDGVVEDIKDTLFEPKDFGPEFKALSKSDFFEVLETKYSFGMDLISHIERLIQERIEQEKSVVVDGGIEELPEIIARIDQNVEQLKESLSAKLFKLSVSEMDDVMALLAKQVDELTACLELEPDRASIQLIVDLLRAITDIREHVELKPSVNPITFKPLLNVQESINLIETGLSETAYVVNAKFKSEMIELLDSNLSLLDTFSEQMPTVEVQELIIDIKLKVNQMKLRLTERNQFGESAVSEKFSYPEEIAGKSLLYLSVEFGRNTGSHILSDGSILLSCLNDEKEPQFYLIPKSNSAGQLRILYAIDLNNQSEVALKPYKKSEHEAMQTELMVYQKMNYKNVSEVAIRSDGDEELYLCLPFAQGSLKDVSKLETEHAVDIAKFVLKLVTEKYLQLGDLVHRDIKPENILIDRNLELIIADGELAKSEGSIAEPAGTGQYVDPDMIRYDDDGKIIPYEVNQKHDVYSLALTIATLLGYKPKHQFSFMAYDLLSNDQAKKDFLCEQMPAIDVRNKDHEQLLNLLMKMLGPIDSRPGLLEIAEIPILSDVVAGEAAFKECASLLSRSSI